MRSISIRHTWTQHPLAFVLSLALLFVLPLSGCSDDGPTGPGRDAGTFTSSAGSLNFGTVLASSASTRSFTVTAATENSGAVSGRVALTEGSDPTFSVTEGAGDFTLDPGQTHEISVRFQPTASGVASTAAIELGDGSEPITCRGFGSTSAFYEFTPTELSGGTVRTNYSPFAGSGVAVSYGTGRSHAASPSWLDCGPVAKWIFNGNGVSESTVGYTFSVPGGVSGVTVRLGLDVERDCVQTLIQIDGDENRYEDLSGCQTLSKSFSLSPGSHTIRVGTDQQGLCGGDLEVRSIRFVFQGLMVPESQWVN